MATPTTEINVQELLAQMQRMQEQLAALQGEKLGLKEPPDTSLKTYFHRTPGSNIVIMRKGPNGENLPDMIFFDALGELTTDDPIIHAFMKPLLTAPGSPISLVKREEKDPLLTAAAKEVQTSAARSIEKMGAEASKA